MVGDCNSELELLLVLWCNTAQLISSFNLGVICFLRLADGRVDGGSLDVAVAGAGERFLLPTDKEAGDDCDEDEGAEVEVEEGELVAKVLLQS